MFTSNSYDRFGGRHRGRAVRQGCRQSWRSSTPETTRHPSPPTGPVVTVIRYNELAADQVSSCDAKITGLEDVASYNWLRANEPTIITPG